MLNKRGRLLLLPSKVAKHRPVSHSKKERRYNKSNKKMNIIIK